MPDRPRAPLLLKLAALLGVAAPLAVVFAAVGADVGWVSFDFAVGVLTLQLGWWLAVVGTILGLAVTATTLSSARTAWPVMAVAVLAPALTFAGLTWAGGRADALPPVHETATDWDRPLSFTDTITRARGPDAWPIEADPVIPEDIAQVRALWTAYAGRRVAEINAEACPGARTLPRMATPQAVIEALEAEGVRVLGQAPWRVEGTRESVWFGRSRDVVVRMEPGATDIRISERRGDTDLGETCRLATAVLERLGAG